VDEHLVDFGELHDRLDDGGLDLVGHPEGQIALDLDVEAHVDLRADVVGDDVVDARDLRVADGPPDDLLSQRVRGRGSDEVIDVVPDDLVAGVEDAERDDAGGDGIEQRVPREGARDAGQRGECCEDVDTIVPRSRDDGRRVVLPTDRQTVPVEPVLDGRRHRQDADRDRAPGHRDPAGQDAPAGLPEDGPAGGEHAERNEEGDEGLDALVAVGVFEVRRLGREIQAGDDHQTVDGVGEAVDRLRADGQTPGGPPDAAFRRREREVDGEDEQADPPERDPPRHGAAIVGHP
jgi:hypothetical protein